MKRRSLLLPLFSLIAASVCQFASGFCKRHAFSLSGAAREDWFELSRLSGFAEAAFWFVIVAMLARHAVDARRARVGRAPTSAAWTAVALAVALLAVPALWLLDYRRELYPKLEQTVPVESFAKEFPGVPLPDGDRSVVLDETYLAGYVSYSDRIPFAVRGHRFTRIRPDKFHHVYGSIDIVPADTNLVYVHSCRARYRTTLEQQGVRW
ncbi:MAG: hypothetical protein IJS32_03765 [Kiritimatiellae bacterium]|nr:hypothetical protein [Kiritimatiellia bacterium]